MDAGEYIIYETQAGYRFGVVIGGGAMALAQSYRGVPIGYIMLSEGEIAALIEFYQKVAAEDAETLALTGPHPATTSSGDLTLSPSVGIPVSSTLLTEHECQCEGGCQCQ